MKISRHQKLLTVAEAKLKNIQDFYYNNYPEDNEIARKVWYQVYAGCLRMIIMKIRKHTEDGLSEYIDISYYRREKESLLKAMSEIRNIEYNIYVAEYIAAKWYYDLLTNDDFLNEEYEKNALMSL